MLQAFSFGVKCAKRGLALARVHFGRFLRALSSWQRCQRLASVHRPSETDLVPSTSSYRNCTSTRSIVDLQVALNATLSSFRWPYKMQLKQLLVSFLSLTTVNAAGCDNSCGVANGECVYVYSELGCSDDYKIAQFQPAQGCGTYFTGSYSSIYACGDGTYGTDCYAYFDDNCEDLIGSTGNIVTAFSQHCVDFGGAQSFKRPYRC